MSAVLVAGIEPRARLGALPEPPPVARAELGGPPGPLAKILELGRKISPITHVTADTAPTLIIHGDKDMLVPIQQSDLVMAKLEEFKIPHKLVIRDGKGHGWPELGNDIPLLADWFSEHLGKK